MNAGAPLKTLLALASPLRSGDVLAEVAARTEEERVRAQMALGYSGVRLKDDMPAGYLPFQTLSRLDSK